MEARKEAVQAHDAEQEVVQMEGLYTVADGMCIGPKEISRHSLQGLKDVSIVLQSREILPQLRNKREMHFCCFQGKHSRAVPSQTSLHL